LLLSLVIFVFMPSLVLLLPNFFFAK